MKEEEILKLINAKIRDHELRVAVISGILGLSVTAGIVHAIHLNHILLLS
jgi:hypothetical protein